MQSRSMRMLFAALSVIAAGALATFVISSERQITARRSALRAFDLQAREAADAFADVRSGQQAYVAAGQAVAVWVPKVDAALNKAATIVLALQQAATSPISRGTLDEAGTTLGQFSTVDKRIRGYIK